MRKMAIIVSGQGLITSYIIVIDLAHCCICNNEFIDQISLEITQGEWAQKAIAKVYHYFTWGRKSEDYPQYLKIRHSMF